MKTKMLLANRLRKPAWFVFVISSLMGIYYLVFEPNPAFFQIELPQILREKKTILHTNNLLDEIISILIIISGLTLVFSKEKREDEFTAKIRMESLIVAIVIHYVLIVLGVVFLYDFTFLFFMICSMFTPILFFIVRFYVKMAQLNKGLYNEE